MSYDEMELDMIGDQRTAMFVIISDTDDTFNFVVGGIAYWICDLAGIESYGCQLIGGLVVFLTRILAVKYHICLPILKGGEEAED